MPRKRRECEVCGSDYQPNGNEQRTCSRSCGDKIRRPRTRHKWPACKVSFIECAMCGHLFASPTSNRKCCGDTCRGAYYRQLNTDWNRLNRAREPREVPCLECGTAHMAKTTRSFCSDKCRTRRRRRYKSWRSRASHYGVPFENITWLDVMLSLDWKCGICGDDIDPSLRHPDDMCATVDHITPMAKGGGHVWGNVQPAHWLCNVLKGVDPDVDFRLEDEPCPDQPPSSTRPAAIAA